MTTTFNFTVPAGDMPEVTMTCTTADLPESSPTLIGGSITWWAAATKFSDPDEVAIKKHSDDPSPAGITIDSATSFTVMLDRIDTRELLGEYYHEAQVETIDGHVATIVSGVMTVNKTMIVRGDDTP